MSNRLLALARRVDPFVVDGGQRRALRPSERLVLTALADDARDGDGGRARLGPAELRRRTGCSERAVRYAFRVLADNGHITRESGRDGAVAATLVHPLSLVAGCNPLHPPGATHCTPGVQPIAPPLEYKELTIDHVPASARASRGVEEEAPAAPAFSPDVVAVFDRWDRVAAAAGLPGPVTRTAARARAIDLRLGEEGLWRVLAAVDAVGRSDFLRGRRPNQQGDFFKSNFDWIFLQRTEAGIARFTQLLEGNFTGGVAVPRGPTAPPARPPDRPGEPPGMRAAIEQAVGARPFAAWFGDCRIEHDDGGLVVAARSAFVAEEISCRFAAALDRVAGRDGWQIVVGAVAEAGP